MPAEIPADGELTASGCSPAARAARPSAATNATQHVLRLIAIPRAAFVGIGWAPAKVEHYIAKDSYAIGRTRTQLQSLLALRRSRAPAGRGSAVVAVEPTSIAPVGRGAV